LFRRSAALPSTFEVPIFLDYFAVCTWALSGAILGVRKGYDITGVFVVALLSSVGGSLLRDGLFLHKVPPVASNPYYLPLILGVTLFVAVFARIFFLSAVNRHTANLIDWIDSIGTPAFAVVGMQLSLAAGIPLPGVALIGALNGVGGGVLRDVLVGDVPSIMQPGLYFALLVAITCILFLVLTLVLGIDSDPAAWTTVAAFVVLRLLVARFNLRSRPLLPLE
jgi:uncharacterized membrane protein YeiH